MKPDHKRKNRKKQNMRTLIPVITVSGILVIILITALALALRRNGRGSSAGNRLKQSLTSDTSVDSDTSYTPEPEEVSFQDADSYYRSIGDVISVSDAGSSSKVFSEKDMESELKKRGFDQYPIQTGYSMKGEFLNLELTEMTDEKHPLYKTYYRNAADEMWAIVVVDDTIVAYASGFNLESDSGKFVILTEKDTIKSYDGKKNQFYELTPKKDVITVIRVNRIDSGNLDQMTYEEIKKRL